MHCVAKEMLEDVQEEEVEIINAASIHAVMRLRRAEKALMVVLMMGVEWVISVTVSGFTQLQRRAHLRQGGDKTTLNDLQTQGSCAFGRCRYVGSRL